jgi:TnpA family transposase
MPRRSILTDTERENLFALPDNQEDLIRYFSFSERDLSIIRQHRGAANRIGFAVQLCYMRYPGIILGTNETPHPAILRLVATQIDELVRETLPLPLFYVRLEVTQGRMA